MTHVRPVGSEPPPPLPYGVPARCDRCERMPKRAWERCQKWSAVLTAKDRTFTLYELGEPVEVGLWYVATRIAGDSEHTARLMGGYSTPAALMEALAGKVVFAQETP